MPPDPPSFCMLRMQCACHTLYIYSSPFTQHLPDQSKIASYTPVVQIIAAIKEIFNTWYATSYVQGALNAHIIHIVLS